MASMRYVKFLARLVPVSLLAVSLAGAAAPSRPDDGRPTAEESVRFLEQSTWGPTSDLIQHVQDVGFEEFLNEQFNAPMSSYPTLPLYPTTITPDCAAAPTCRRDNYSLYVVQNRFFTNALYGEDQLRQRVSFALHQIFVVSGSEIKQSSWMAPYLQTLDRNAFGNFRQLLYEITLNPAMGKYLDMANNRKEAPNENYAREVLQLFSIGLVRLNPDGSSQLDANGLAIPTYDQKTVTEFARVFTGWNLAAGPAAGVPNYIDPMVANAKNHDTGEKTLLRGEKLKSGQTPAKDLSDAIDNIFEDPNVGPFICKQLIQHLVTSNPSPAYVERVVKAFNNNGSKVRGDMQAVVKAILLDVEARRTPSTQASPGHLMHPILLITNLLRALNAKSADKSGNSDGYLNPQAQPMGMDLFNPPSVFSYYSPSGGVPGTSLRGPEFGLLNTSTTLARTNFVNNMVFSRIAATGNATAGTSLDFSALQPQAKDPSALVDSLNLLLMGGTMSDAMKDSIVKAVTAIPSSDSLQRARTAVYLIATSAQYQVR